MRTNHTSKKYRINRNCSALGSPVRGFLSLLLVLVGVSGCATPYGALGGMTKLDLKFRDEIPPTYDREGNVIESGQVTEFSNKSRVPAGVEVHDIVALRYEWNPDYSGEISISKDNEADTLGQADLLNAVATVQTQLVLEKLSNALDTLSPLLAVLGEQRTTRSTSEDTSETLRLRMLGEILENAMEKPAESNFSP